MLKIREEQFGDYLQSDAEAFIDLNIEHLQEECPEYIANTPADALREMIANGITRARSHGLRSDANLLAFVALMFEIAPDFDQQPEIAQVLDDPSVPADDRFDLMFERVSDEAWEAAAANYDSDAWFPELLNEAND